LIAPPPAPLTCFCHTPCLPGWARDSQKQAPPRNV
jgi:hypothetical protein